MINKGVGSIGMADVIFIRLDPVGTNTICAANEPRELDAATVGHFIVCFRTFANPVSERPIAFWSVSTTTQDGYLYHYWVGRSVGKPNL